MTAAGRGRDVSDEEILSAFSESQDPVLSTSEVAERIGLERRGTLDRLNTLKEEGVISGKRVGAGSVWWYPEAVRDWNPHRRSSLE